MELCIHFVDFIHFMAMDFMEFYGFLLTRSVILVGLPIKQAKTPFTFLWVVIWMMSVDPTTL